LLSYISKTPRPDLDGGFFRYNVGEFFELWGEIFGGYFFCSKGILNGMERITIPNLGPS
jgi:hypothetical protein